MNEENLSDNEWFQKRYSEKKKARKIALKNAKIDADKRGKEAFNIDELKKYWRFDRGSLTKEQEHEAYEHIGEKYYLEYVDIMSIKELAEYLKELDKYIG